jgi:hypothetical protein
MPRTARLLECVRTQTPRYATNAYDTQQRYAYSKMGRIGWPAMDRFRSSEASLSKNATRTPQRTLPTLEPISTLFTAAVCAANEARIAVTFGQREGAIQAEPRYSPPRCLDSIRRATKSTFSCNSIIVDRFRDAVVGSLIRARARAGGKCCGERHDSQQGRGDDVPSGK